MNICSAATDTTLTVWWEQPENVPADAVYTVVLDDSERQECRRTHCTFDGLSPEKDCRIAVWMNGTEIGRTEAKTRAVPRRLNVCAFGAKGDGEGSPVPPKFSDILCERVHLTGWARNYWEQELHAMPGIDLSGFDEPGYEAENIAFVECSMGKEASVSLKHCRHISLNLLESE